MRPQWPKSTYQFLFYYGETKSLMNKKNAVKVNAWNCQKTVLVTAWLHVATLVHMTWLFAFGNTCCNHCDVTVMFVTLNFSHTPHHNWQTKYPLLFLQNISILLKCFDNIIFENAKMKIFTRVKLPHCKHTDASIHICHIIIIHVCFLKLFECGF